ncbi:MAG: hypothetical protein AAB263_22465 [Planctomycetota bacterium]
MRKIPLERKVEYIYRSVGYGLIIAIYLVFNLSKNAVVLGAISGFILGDYVTWLGRSLMRLPGDWLDFSIDAIAVILISVVLFGYCGVRIPTDPGGMAVGMLVFLTVIMVKTSFFMIDERDHP